MMYQAVTITSNGNRYQRTLYAITFIRDYIRAHPDGLRRFVIDEDIAKDVRAQFYKKYKVKIVKRRWGNNFHNELTYITIEDWT